MKGYYISVGFMGYLPSEGKYILFATEQDYVERYYDEIEP